MSSKKKTKIEQPSASKFSELQKKLESLDHSIEDIEQEENLKLNSSDKKKVESNRKLRKKDSLSDSDDLAPSVDYDIEESSHKGIQEFKIQPEIVKNDDEYGEDDFEDSLEDKHDSKKKSPLKSIEEISSKSPENPLLSPVKQTLKFPEKEPLKSPIKDSDISSDSDSLEDDNIYDKQLKIYKEVQLDKVKDTSESDKYLDYKPDDHKGIDEFKIKDTEADYDDKFSEEEISGDQKTAPQNTIKPISTQNQKKEVTQATIKIKIVLNNVIFIQNCIKNKTE